MVEVTRSGTFIGSNVHSYEHLYSEALEVIDTEKNIAKEDYEIVDSIKMRLKSKKIAEYIKEGDQFNISHQELDWMSKHPKNTWLEYLIYRYKFKIYPKQKILEDFPQHILIEPVSGCNLKCIMCFQIDKTFTTSEHMGHMDWELFIKIVDEIKREGCNAVTLASRGEPTLHKRFGDMLKYLHEASILDIKINTNATRLTEELCHQILKAQVSEVVFSVDAATKTTYEKIRVGGKFEEVVSNIERFNSIRKEYYPNSPTVTRIAGIQILDEQDIEQMSAFWSSRVDQVLIKKAIPRWDSYNREFSDLEKPCHQLWERMYIWHDGRTNPCDFDYKSHLCTGDANKDSLKKIWRDTYLNNLRESHLKKNRGTISPCSRCPLS